MNYKAPIEFDAIDAVHLPMSERVLDKLTDILFASHQILDMTEMKDQVPDATTREVRASVASVYEQVNELMKKLAD
ncbi:MAG TPA: hypothetical protein VFO89_04120 [Thermoanaerobaculia bacterium]|nr:hypothetical protein [Thermoanaerobaculia bacterium]